MRFSFLKFVVPAVAASLAFAAPVKAETLTWHIRSDYPYVVSLEFYSQSRNHAWPGGGKVYVLDDSNAHTYNLSCNYGESICFGAWVRGESDQYWGVGAEDSQYCTDCCYPCDGGETGLRILNP